jgi:protein-S-isoprenylcysteine O-methyltransferase Ste14
MNETVDHANVRFPPPLLYLGALILGVALGWMLHIEGWPAYRSLSVYVGGTFTLLGIVLILWGAGLFRRAGTNVKPWEPANALVTTGLYRQTRNPMYLGMTLLYFGLAVLLHSIVALLLLPVVLIVTQTQVIAREERYLEARFGDDYRTYKSRVRRWL